MRSHDDYHAYLIRLWREGENRPWRATVEDAHTGERVGFANLRRMFEFLEDQTEKTASGKDPSLDPETGEKLL
jgi:hypothetical protein